METCCVEGCVTPVRYRARQLCGLHYQRWHKHGDVHFPDPRLERRPLADRFWEKINKSGPVLRAELGPCWVWIARSNVQGYGYIQRGGRNGGRVLAHRLSWELTSGAVPAGLDVLHKCDSPPCVNPDHLFLGTAADNSADMHAKGREYDTFRERPELVRGEANNLAKLKREDIVEIRRRRALGETLRKLGDAFGVTRQNIGFIVRGETWKEVG